MMMVSMNAFAQQVKPKFKATDGKIEATYCQNGEVASKKGFFLQTVSWRMDQLGSKGQKTAQAEYNNGRQKTGNIYLRVIN
jgi:hypothetical protein